MNMINEKMKDSIELSIVSPVYNEEGNLQELYNQLINILENELKVTYEVIFVEDGQDRSWKIIEEFKKQKKNIKGIRLSRRFGHQSALKAGMDYSSGMLLLLLTLIYSIHQ